MKSLLISFTLLLLASTSQALTLDGVTLANRYQAEGQNLILNGAGVRSKFFIDVYVGALYLQQKSTDNKAVIKADKPMAMRLHITSDLIDGKKMASATRDGFVKSTKGNLAPIQKSVDRLIGAFKDEVKKGDQFDLLYIPQKGVIIFRNGKLKTTVEGLKFKQALFGIWLSDDPVQDSLKEGMMGEK